jgi:hypothetical protein
MFGLHLQTCRLFAWMLFAISAIAPASADVRHLSIMPDPRGEFIRLCAPFMVSRYAHPETVCDCLRSALRNEVGDQDIYDALLYGVTERGVPNLTSTWLPLEKRTLISRTMTAIAEPTMECMFGENRTTRTLEGIPPSSFGPMPPVQDLTP